MPNPNEMARLEEELAEARINARNLNVSKAGRRLYVSELRDLERQLGLPHEDIVHPTREQTFVKVGYQAKEARSQMAKGIDQHFERLAEGFTLALNDKERMVILAALQVYETNERFETERLALIEELTN